MRPLRGESRSEITDRHDINARVFRVKVKHIMRLLTKGCIFGNIRPEFIDKVICAELPDSILDPALYEITSTTMTQGPCRHINKSSPCMLNGNCRKKYPRCFRKETQTGEDGYPQYRRRSPEDCGIITQIKDNNVDNRWVVPYNPVLSHTFNAHINVEFCNSVKSIKYICKYVNKGTDQATFSVEDQDEFQHTIYGKIANFIEGKKERLFSGYLEIKKDQVLGRVHPVHPVNAESYYLRLLLHKTPGPTSFIALKIVAGVVQPSFQAACKALGLLEDDAHWNSTLEEASISESPNKIHIVISMSGKALLRFGFLSPSREARFAISNHQYVKELAYDTVHLSKIVAENVPKLNQEQKEIYDKILNSVTSNSGQCYFLDSHGETGKTFLINLLLAKIRCERSIAIAVASSGTAAALIDGGKAAHSAFKLPLNLHHSESVNCNISKQSDMANALREAKLIIWDECTMAHKKGIEALNMTLQDIRGCNQKKIMGGLTLLLSGDFRKTLLIVLRGTRADIVKACLKTSFLWPHIKVASLRINMRVHLQHDLRAEMFSKLLIDIGDGTIKEMEGRKIFQKVFVILLDI
ncbi:ATP-dependent DNA helicase [Trichonephila clavipes]|nr:ATP-dependent DNA helicase [Trichonephila clavipes]